MDGPCEHTGDHSNNTIRNSGIHNCNKYLNYTQVISDTSLLPNNTRTLYTNNSTSSSSNTYYYLGRLSEASTICPSPRPADDEGLPDDSSCFMSSNKSSWNCADNPNEIRKGHHVLVSPVITKDSEVHSHENDTYRMKSNSEDRFTSGSDGMYYRYNHSSSDYDCTTGSKNYDYILTNNCTFNTSSNAAAQSSIDMQCENPSSTAQRNSIYTAFEENAEEERSTWDGVAIESADAACTNGSYNTYCGDVNLMYFNTTQTGAVGVSSKYGPSSFPTATSSDRTGTSSDCCGSSRRLKNRKEEMYIKDKRYTRLLSDVDAIAKVNWRTSATITEHPNKTIQSNHNNIHNVDVSTTDKDISYKSTEIHSPSSRISELCKSSDTTTDTIGTNKNNENNENNNELYSISTTTFCSADTPAYGSSSANNYFPYNTIADSSSFYQSDLYTIPHDYCPRVTTSPTVHPDLDSFIPNSTRAYATTTTSTTSNRVVTAVRTSGANSSSHTIASRAADSKSADQVVCMDTNAICSPGDDTCWAEDWAMEAEIRNAEEYYHYNLCCNNNANTENDTPCYNYSVAQINVNKEVVLQEKENFVENGVELKQETDEWRENGEENGRPISLTSRFVEDFKSDQDADYWEARNERASAAAVELQYEDGPSWADPVSSLHGESPVVAAGKPTVSKTSGDEVVRRFDEIPSAFPPLPAYFTFPAPPLPPCLPSPPPLTPDEMRELFLYASEVSVRRPRVPVLIELRRNFFVLYRTLLDVYNICPAPYPPCFFPFPDNDYHYPWKISADDSLLDSSEQEEEGMKVWRDQSICCDYCGSWPGGVESSWGKYGDRRGHGLGMENLTASSTLLGSAGTPKREAKDDRTSAVIQEEQGEGDEEKLLYFVDFFGFVRCTRCGAVRTPSKQNTYELRYNNNNNENKYQNMNYNGKNEGEDEEEDPLSYIYEL